MTLATVTTKTNKMAAYAARFASDLNLCKVSDGSAIAPLSGAVATIMPNGEGVSVDESVVNILKNPMFASIENWRFSSNGGGTGSFTVQGGWGKIVRGTGGYDFIRQSVSATFAAGTEHTLQFRFKNDNPGQAGIRIGYFNGSTSLGEKAMTISLDGSGKLVTTDITYAAPGAGTTVFCDVILGSYYNQSNPASYIEFSYGQLEARGFVTAPCDASRANGILRFPLTFKPNMTICFWRKGKQPGSTITSQATSPNILEVGDYYTNGSLTLWSYCGRNMASYGRSDIAAGWDYATGTVLKTFADDIDFLADHHYAVVFSGDTTKITAYEVFLDGESLGGKRPISGGITAWAGSYFGFMSANGKPPNATYRELYVFEDALTQAEIQDIMNKTAGAFKEWKDCSFSWQDVRAAKAWSETAQTKYTTTVDEDINVAEKPVKTFTSNNPEAFALSDKAAKTFTSNNPETLSVSDKAAKTTSLLKQETLHVAEKPVNTLDKIAKETLGIEDHWNGYSLTKKVLEVLGVSDTYIDYITFLVRIAETIGIAEKPIKDFDKAPFLETLHVAEKPIKQFTAISIDTIGIAEKPVKTFDNINNETLNVAELTVKDFTSNNQETLHVAEKPIKQMTLLESEAFHIAEQYTDAVNFVRKFTETLNVIEFISKHSDVTRKETLRVTEKPIKTFQSNNPETISVAEVNNNTVQFKRVFAEAVLNISDGIAKAHNLTKKEALHILEQQIRNANTVLSDLFFSSQEMDLDAFLANGTPIGYEPFKDFTAGDYEYAKALMRLFVQAGDTDDKPLVSSWKLNVDVTDTVDRGIVELPAQVTFVPFNKQFYEPPDVRVLLRGGTPGDEPDIIQITDEGFYVVVNDENGIAIAGVISWSAVGY